MKVIVFERLRSEKGITYSRDHLRRKCGKGEFPKPVPLSAHRIAWLEEEIDAWLAVRAARRDSARQGDH
jgi:prophage regulatory protein